MMEMFAIYLPIDREYLKVDGEYFFSYEEANQNLDMYKQRMTLMISSSEDEQYKRLLKRKIYSAALVQRVLH